MSIIMDSAAILNLPMKKNDANAATIREYLVALTREVWDHGEGFSGKRPFGNSSWEHEIYITLAVAGVIDSTTDEDGDVDYTREEQRRADGLIVEAIEAMATSEPPTTNNTALFGPFGLSVEQEIRARALETAVKVGVDRGLMGADTLDLAKLFAAWVETGADPE